MVNEFIEKIVVFEAEKINGKREQRVDIYLNFIGNFIAPIMDIPLSAKEVAEQEEAERLRLEKLQRQKDKSREKSRDWREKIKGTDKEQQALEKRRAKYAESRASEKPYKPQKKYQSA